MKSKLSLLLLTFSLFASACGVEVSAAPALSEVEGPAPVLTSTPLPTRTPASSPTTIPSPTAEPYYIDATVWTEEPRVPMLAYHQLAPDTSEYSTGHKVRVSDLRAQLESLNNAGFTLVAVEDWINGDITLPPGRKPLIISMDDLFFNNQITLGADGVPTTDTSIGIFWQFAQEHPEFGFHLALFSNLGDKLYAEPDFPDWEEKLARAIAWCEDHGARVYNHTYRHARLDLTDPPGVKSELRRNDLYLRELLTMIGREDLIPALGNMLATPFGNWPDSNGTYVMEHYTTPEGVSMQAIFGIDNNERAGFVPPPYSPDFNRFHLMRIAARPVTIQYLVDHKNEFPAAEACRLGPLESARLSDTEYVAGLIKLAVDSETCPIGVYQVQGNIFDARDPAVPIIFP
jgi:hypothetical protein